MIISSFWLQFFKEAKEGETLRLAKEVVSALTAEAEAYTWYEEHKEFLETWRVWDREKAGRIIEQFTEAIACWYRVIECLFECNTDIWEVLCIEIEVVKHACFCEQAHLSRMISTILAEQQAWGKECINQSAREKAATLFERREQEGHAEQD